MHVKRMRGGAERPEIKKSPSPPVATITHKLQDVPQDFQCSQGSIRVKSGLGRLIRGWVHGITCTAAGIAGSHWRCYCVGALSLQSPGHTTAELASIPLPATLHGLCSFSGLRSGVWCTRHQSQVHSSLHLLNPKNP